MTLTVAVAGKSGSGKTTITKNMLTVFRKVFPEKSILLFDNDLTCELGHTFGKDIRKTIYGIRSGKHEYKTGIPKNMSKQEYIEWAIEDILEPIDSNTDLIVSWLTASKDCRCPITKQINDALVKLINRYDIVIFDCEFDLKYLYQLVDVPIDITLIVTKPTNESAKLAQRIEEYSAKYAANGQMGVVLNCVKNDNTQLAYQITEKYGLSILGIIPYDKQLDEDNDKKISLIVENAIEHFYYRLNIPRGDLA
ncbi:AAA family ATPase [bacterium]|nr:AAA family ATPase [bacterium]